MADRTPREQSSTIPPTPAPRRRRPDRKDGIPATAVIGVALAALVAVAALIVAGDALRASSGGALTTSAPSALPTRTASSSAPSAGVGQMPSTAAPSGSVEVVKEGSSKGVREAPVQIVEYADFQCPFCAQAARGPLRQIEEAYIAAGKVRLVFKHFAFIGPESEAAAVAAECAGEQGKFWEYHDKLYASQQGENQGAFARDKLKGFARDLGLDSQQFNACLDANKYQEKVRRDFQEGQRIGVQSTPTFLINDQRFLGAQPFQNFARVIDQELEKKR